MVVVVVIGRRSEPPEMSWEPAKKALPAVSRTRGSAKAEMNHAARRSLGVIGLPPKRALARPCFLVGTVGGEPELLVGGMHGLPETG